MTWIAEHPLLTAAIPVGVVVLAAVGVFVARFYRRPPEAVTSLREWMAAERDEMDSVFDDHPFYEDDLLPGVDFTAETPAPVVAQPVPEESWLDSLRAAPTPPIIAPAAPETTPLEVRPVEITDYDAHEEAEVVSDNGWDGWPRREPPLPMQTTVPEHIAWSVESDLGDPNEGHSTMGHTGAFRWGPDGVLVPVADLVAELRADEPQERAS